jgi:NADPH-dependent glutamate synthase beta subunit-like oxidoreductase
VGTESCRTSIAKVFDCGDMRRGQSLVMGDSSKRARDRKVPHEFRPTRRDEQM